MEYVVLDLETTGLSSVQDAIIEIGAMIVKDGVLIEEPYFHSLINPKRPIPRPASQVHGIYDADLKNAPELADILPSFLEFVGKRPVVAHNISFDVGFLRMGAQRLGYTWQPSDQICTVKMSRQAFPQERKHRLDDVAERYGLTFESRHRSIGDVKVTALAFIQLCQVLKVPL